MINSSELFFQDCRKCGNIRSIQDGILFYSDFRGSLTLKKSKIESRKYSTIPRLFLSVRKLPISILNLRWLLKNWFFRVIAAAEMHYFENSNIKSKLGSVTKNFSFFQCCNKNARKWSKCEFSLRSFWALVNSKEFSHIHGPVAEETYIRFEN